MMFHKIIWNICTGFQEFFTFYKGKGGGGGGGTTTTTAYQSDLPEYAKPFYEELMKQAGKQTYTTDSAGNVTGVKPYVGYTGERLAGFTPQQKAVQAEAAGMTTPAEFAAAQKALGTVGTAGGTAATTGLAQAFGYTPGTYTPGTVSTGSFTAPGVAAKYMDPYTQQVIDVEKAEAKRQADIAKAQAAMGSIGRGTFGGGRQALMQGEQDRATQQLLAGIQTKGAQAAYDRGMQAFEAEQARGLEAQKANEAAKLQAAELGQQGQQYAAGLGRDVGLAGLQAQLDAGVKTAAVAAQEQISQLERLKGQAASGAEQQLLQQQIDNVKYQQFMEEQDYQRKLLEYQSNILRGTSGALGSTQVTYAPAPSLASQIGGGIAGLAGLYGALT